ncbi:FMN-dependent L-lactate dehydrogenase LldD [Novosphingobium sp. fls2-241-R2A-195]|jgi:L-lactate dehydrogenase (cytochrome)|uniref:FMN-dependent L-lactate dehydrogenase LldD n=1 Tax=Novosphingobium sp. fls2-241-R2A-195 TaxID=3040296 RepID=UPI0025514F85|nr:FMN-dependent L-lactate dehydrogenase LldD [Novosphingobium sp. fls2-241-R2A-195]
MIVSSPLDFREAARRRLPPFLFHYLDGGAFSEETMEANRTALKSVRPRQRVLRDVSALSLETTLLGEKLAMPVLLAPIGLGGMMRRRGELQVARAARAANVPYILSTVSVCPLADVIAASGAPIWFQLYVLKDRGFMRHALERAQAMGVTKLVFTVDMPLPGARYRDAHSGMSGPAAPLRRMLQAVTHPRWAWDVGLLGRPHDLGNVSDYRGKPTDLADYIGWLGANFDPSITWSDLEWIREFWQGEMIVKGVLDPEDARDAVRLGADGVIVSNHGGRQLDGALSTAEALPAIADAVGDKLTVLVDGGVRTGLDVVRMLALGADGVLLGRAYIYALAAGGEAGVAKLLDLIAQGMKLTMALSGVTSVDAIGRDMLI